MSMDGAANCRALYERVCTQHDGIAEFRGKLLGLLPIASGAGIFFFFQDSGIAEELRPHLLAIGLFGLAVTTGLFFYELRGIQKCNALIQAARRLEQELSADIEGAFRSKPRAIWGVGAETAALIVYPAVGGAWAYLASLARSDMHGAASALLAGLVVMIGVFAGDKVLQRGRGAEHLQEIRNLNRRSFLAEDRRDRSILEPILDNEFRIVRSSGVQEDKKQMLEELGSTAQGRRIIRQELIEPCGPNSVVAMTLIRYHEGNRFIGDFWNTKVFVGDGREWRCRVWQVARVV